MDAAIAAAISAGGGITLTAVVTLLLGVPAARQKMVEALITAEKAIAASWKQHAEDLEGRVEKLEKRCETLEGERDDCKKDLAEMRALVDAMPAPRQVSVDQSGGLHRDAIDALLRRKP
jgi:hypothetical protein